MTVLIIYGTNSGGTLSAAEEVQRVFVRAGHQATLRSAGVAKPDELGSADLVVLASCTWEKFTPEGKRLDGQLQEQFDAFVSAVGDRTFPGQSFAVMGFGDVSYTKYCAAADLLEQFVARISGTKVGETLRLGGYTFDVLENRGRVIAWTERLMEQLKANVGRSLA